MATNIFDQMSINQVCLLNNELELCKKIFSGIDLVSSTYYARPPLKHSKDIIVSSKVLFGENKNQTVDLRLYLRARNRNDKTLYSLESAFFRLKNKYYVINDFALTLLCYKCLGKITLMF